MKLTKYLIEQKFYLEESIVYAAENNNLPMVKLLAEHGANVDFSQKRRSGLFRKYYVSPIGKAHKTSSAKKVQRRFSRSGVKTSSSLSACN